MAKTKSSQQDIITQAELFEILRDYGSLSERMYDVRKRFERGGATVEPGPISVYTEEGASPIEDYDYAEVSSDAAIRGCVVQRDGADRPGFSEFCRFFGLPEEELRETHRLTQEACDARWRAYQETRKKPEEQEREAQPARERGLHLVTS